MIKSWAHKGLKKFYETGSKAGIQPIHAERLEELLLAWMQRKKCSSLTSPAIGFIA